jgi:hypothetical protein
VPDTPWTRSSTKDARDLDAIGVSPRTVRATTVLVPVRPDKAFMPADTG